MIEVLDLLLDRSERSVGEVLGHTVFERLLRRHGIDGDLATIDQLAKQEEPTKPALHPRAYVEFLPATLNAPVLSHLMGTELKDLKSNYIMKLDR